MNTLIESKMQDVILTVDKDSHTAQLTLDIGDVLKLEEMMEAIHDLSLDWLNENHSWFNYKINEAIKEDQPSRDTNIRLAEFVNKAMLVIGQSGDFAGVLHNKIGEVTNKM